MYNLLRVYPQKRISLFINQFFKYVTQFMQYLYSRICTYIYTYIYIHIYTYKRFKLRPLYN